MSKWKEIKTYSESEAGSLKHNEFNITQDQARLILDIKKGQLNKFQSLSMLDISKDEVKQLAKTDPTIVKAIGKQGGSFRTSMVKQRAGMMEKVNEQFSTGMIDKLRKAYGPLKGKRINPTPLMKTFDKIDKNKDALIQLYKADIPFVSQMAVSRLISKHNMKGKDINKLRDKYGVTTGYSKLSTDFKVEDAPTNSVASGGVDMNPTGLSKKKRDLDGRTKEYKIHARKLQAQRERRKLKAQKSICGSFRNGMKENTDNFVREEFIVEDNVDILGQIVRRSQAMPLKFKDGTMKIDLTTANMILKNLVEAPAKFMKGSTRTKVMNIINKGRKDQFLRLIDMLYK